MRTSALMVLGFLMGAAGCGSRVVGGGGGEGGSGGPGEGAGQAGGDASSSGGQDTGAGGHPGGTCTVGWAAADPAVVELGESSFRLDAAVGTTSGGLLVGYTAFLDDGSSVAWKVQPLELDLGPSGPPVTVDEAIVTGGLSQLSLVTAEYGVGALYWTDAGASVAGLDDSGYVLGRFSVPTRAAGLLDAIAPDSLSFVGVGNDSDPFAVALFEASPGGVEEVGPIDLEGFHVGRTTFDDGTFVAVWADDDVECVDCDLHLVAQVFASDASPVSAVVPITTKLGYGFLSPGPRLVSTRSGAGVAVGVASSTGIEVFTVDRNGALGGPFLSIPAYDAQAIALSEIPGGSLVLSWLSGTDDQRLGAAVISPSASSVVASWDLGGGFTYGSSPRIAVADDRAVVFADGYDTSSGLTVLRAATIAPCAP